MPVLERVESAQRTVAARLHPFVGPAVVAASAVVAVAYIAQVDPHEGGHYPTCPSLLLTGWYCPGCGSLRAIHDMGNLDLSGAWDMNPLAVLVVPWLLWRWIAWALAAIGRPVSRIPAPAWSLYLLAGTVVGYAVLRNIPAFASTLAP